MHYLLCLFLPYNIFLELLKSPEVSGDGAVTELHLRTADIMREAASRRQPMAPMTTANTLRCQEVTPPLTFPCRAAHRSLPMLVAATLPSPPRPCAGAEPI